MSEFINKDLLITVLKKKKDFGELTAKEAIRTVESILSKEITLCEQCKYWDSIKDSALGYCNVCKHGHVSESWEIGIYRTTRHDFFCADGEQKEKI